MTTQEINNVRVSNEVLTEVFNDIKGQVEDYLASKGAPSKPLEVETFATIGGKDFRFLFEQVYIEECDYYYIAEALCLYIQEADEDGNPIGEEPTEIIYDEKFYDENNIIYIYP